MPEIKSKKRYKTKNPEFLVNIKQFTSKSGFLSFYFLAITSSLSPSKRYAFA